MDRAAAATRTVLAKLFQFQGDAPANDSVRLSPEIEFHPEIQLN